MMVSRKAVLYKLQPSNYKNTLTSFFLVHFNGLSLLAGGLQPSAGVKAI